MAQEKIFIQVGVTALRTPNGRHYPAIPLYVEADKLNASGLAPCEEKRLTNFAGFLSEKYAQRLREQEDTRKDADSGSPANA